MALVMLNYWFGWGEKKDKFFHSFKSSIVDDPKSSVHTFKNVGFPGTLNYCSLKPGEAFMAYSLRSDIRNIV